MVKWDITLNLRMIGLNESLAPRRLGEILYRGPLYLQGCFTPHFGARNFEMAHIFLQNYVPHREASHFNTPINWFSQNFCTSVWKHRRPYYCLRQISSKLRNVSTRLHDVTVQTTEIFTVTATVTSNLTHIICCDW